MEVSLENYLVVSNKVNTYVGSCGMYVRSIIYAIWNCMYVYIIYYYLYYYI